jgi:hypothetical protein
MAGAYGPIPLPVSPLNRKLKVHYEALVDLLATLIGYEHLHLTLLNTRSGTDDGTYEMAFPHLDPSRAGHYRTTTYYQQRTH